MSVAAHAGRRSFWTPWRVASRVMQAAAFLTILYLTARIFIAVREQGLWASLDSGQIGSLVGAGVVYMAGQGFRVFRLALLVGGWRVGFRDIASFHFMTAAASLAAPFKLGEAYRVLEMTNVAEDGIRGLVVAWWERVFDAVTLFVLLALALAETSTIAPAYRGVALLIVLFVLATAVVFWVVPQNIHRVSVLIIRRHRRPETVWVLRLLDLVGRTIESAPSVVARKVASLATLTCLIWFCEITSFMLAMGMLGDFDAARDALLGFLSSIVGGATLLTGAAVEGSALRPLLPYLVVTQGSLAFVGLAAGLHYMRRNPVESYLPRSSNAGRRAS